MRWNLGLNPPRNPCGEKLLALARESLNPTTSPEENPTWPTCQPPRPPLPRRLSGEGTFRTTPFGRPGTTTWKRTVLPYLVDVKRKTSTYCILPRFGVDPKE